ncbi:rho-related GTP-binding protein RhoD isoform X2 [Loxodonta africana]|uniref:rho-related GTP-binding protein RhoD isoform X2 n=1 Tax=Loxodonta africana TaxID=9785 RepID=UPI0005405293|nr:rho-related GTP-binding protein RhoD isoform X2 [Loxodonta africana]
MKAAQAPGEEAPPGVQSAKVVLVGDGGCGKTSLLMVFAEGDFPENYTPTVFERYNVNLQIKGKPVHLQIWDTAVVPGGESFLQGGTHRGRGLQDRPAQGQVTGEKATEKWVGAGDLQQGPGDGKVCGCSGLSGVLSPSARQRPDRLPGSGQGGSQQPQAQLLEADYEELLCGDLTYPRPPSLLPLPPGLTDTRQAVRGGSGH